MNLRFQTWKLKTLKLLQSSIPQPGPFVLRPQLADCCHFTLSLFFYAFYLRAGWGGIIRAFAVTDTARCLEDYLFFCLDAKETKDQAWIFLSQNHRTNFPIATPAARVSHSTRGSLPVASAEILTVILRHKNIRAIRRGFIRVFTVAGTILYFENDFLLFSSRKKVKKIFIGYRWVIIMDDYIDLF